MGKGSTSTQQERSPLRSSVITESGRVIPLTPVARFLALQSGEVDILCRNVTLILQRDTALGLNFAPQNFYDGEGFMVPKKMNIKSAKDWMARRYAC